MKRMLPMLRVICVLALTLIVLSIKSFSQLSINTSDLEAGITIAPSNFLGDLGGTKGKGGNFLKDNNLSNTRILVSGHVSVRATDWLYARLAATYGNIGGDDAMIKANGGLEEARKTRNQNFRSKISEAYVAAEIYPTVFLESDPSTFFHKLRPYAIAGIGVFHFNPEGKDPLTGEWVKLHPLHLEGQGFPEYADRKNYGLTQINIPLGFGIKYYTSETVSISLEALMRKTFSDYIDDVSTTYIDPNLFFQHLDQASAIVANRMFDKSVGAANRNSGGKRGSPANKDSYYAVGFKISFRLGGNGYGSLRCPLITRKY
ncbi:MAG: hypothetical protein ABI151_01065 [Chitinophagaceae bacterium]